VLAVATGASVMRLEHLFMSASTVIVAVNARFLKIER